MPNDAGFGRVAKKSAEITEKMSVENERVIPGVAMFYLDMMGEICPHPLHMAQAKLEQLEIGDTLVLETDFGRSVRNILAWADKAGHQFDVEEVDQGVWQVKITKTY